LLTGNDGNCFSADTKADHERGLNAGLLGEIQNGDYQRRQRNCGGAVGIPHFDALRHDKYQEQGPTDEVLSRHFFSETNAAKCFAKAKPDVDKQRPKEFLIGCKMTGGGEEEPIVYTFTRGRTGWKFTGFDNINE